LGPDGKIKEAKAVSVDAHIVPVKASVIDNHSRHFQPPGKHLKFLSKKM
jgi:hypothetical protein